MFQQPSIRRTSSGVSETTEEQSNIPSEALYNIDTTSQVIICGKNRRQRQAEAAALSAAAGSLNNQIHPAIRNMDSTSPHTRGIISSLPQDNPPPYTYPEKQPVLDKKEEPLESSYETIAHEWLSAGQQQGRKPSFNSYHSFDTRAAPATSQDPRSMIGAPVQGGQVQLQLLPTVFSDGCCRDNRRGRSEGAVVGVDIVWLTKCALLVANCKLLG